jgi:hypothetical protein
MPDNWPDCSPAELAYLVFNGSYGQQLCARRLLEAIAREDSTWKGFMAVDSLPRQVFPKGRWTV